MASNVYHLRCRCGAYAARSWVDERKASNRCEQCGQAMNLTGITRKTAEPANLPKEYFDIVAARFTERTKA